MAESPQEPGQVLRNIYLCVIDTLETENFYMFKQKTIQFTE